MDSKTATVAMMGIFCSSGLIMIAMIIWATRNKRPQAENLHIVADRLDRIEQAVDTIAIEIERISEAQRFTTKVLTERAVDGVKAPVRVVTPH